MIIIFGNMGIGAKRNCSVAEIREMKSAKRIGDPRSELNEVNRVCEIRIAKSM
jgi:hypothetical protein